MFLIDGGGLNLGILYVSVFQFKLGCDIAWVLYWSCEEVGTCAVRHVNCLNFFLRNKMASGFGGYEEFMNIMRADTTEEVTPDNQDTVGGLIMARFAEIYVWEN